MKKKILRLIMVIFFLTLISGCNKDNYYTVTFKGLNEEVLTVEQVKEGESATAPTLTNIPGYEFIKWDKKFDENGFNLNEYEHILEYDENNNLIHHKNSSGIEYWNEWEAAK